jgi:ribosomal protein L21E
LAFCEEKWAHNDKSMVKIETTVKNGRIDRNRSKLSEVIAKFEGRDIVITIDIKKKQRSSPQNKYYHGVVVPLITNYIVEAGNVWTKANTHEAMKQLFLRVAVKVNEAGEYVERIKSTTELDTHDFEVYLEQIKQWASDSLGLIIPDPNEQLTIL